MVKKTAIILVIIVTIILVVYNKYFGKEKKIEIEKSENTNNYNSNLLENVEYIAKDSKGNLYIIKATKGEIDYNNNNIIFLEEVKSQIKLTNSDEINIKSDFGKYNTSNYDTIFSKNVKIDYLENKITGEYLDFSLIKNKMIFSRNIIYTNLENILQADVIEIDIDTKNTKIFMYEENKKVNMKIEIIKMAVIKNLELNHLKT